MSNRTTLIDVLSDYINSGDATHEEQHIIGQMIDRLSSGREERD